MSRSKLPRMFQLKQTQDEFLEAYTKYKETGDLNQIFPKIRPIIEYGWRTFGGGLPSLYGIAKKITLRALPNYDPSKGDLKSYLMLNLQELQKKVPESGEIISASYELRLLNKQLEEAEKELEDKYNRAPSDQELADFLGVSLKKIERARKLTGSVPESTFEGGQIGIQPLDDNATQKEIHPLWVESIYKTLSPVDQFILDSRLGLHGRKQLGVEEIARKLKMSVGSVSLRMKQLSDKLTVPEKF